MLEDNKVTIRASVAQDITDLKDNLRKADIEELSALGSTPLVSLCEGFLYSDKCYTCLKGNKPIGMFGLSKTLIKNQGSIWFLGSYETLKYPKGWLKIGGQYINDFLKIYPVLTNIVSVNNIEHINWLKHLGAIFSAPYKFNDNLFQDFYFIKKEG